MSKLAALNLKSWIEEHRHLLKPSVGNQYLYRGQDFFVQGLKSLATVGRAPSGRRTKRGRQSAMEVPGDDSPLTFPGRKLRSS
jgi:hypothetical protein